MSDRDRLIELLNRNQDYGATHAISQMDERKVYTYETPNSVIADHILADGWIRLPCKAGDHIFWVDKIDGTITEFIVSSIETVCRKGNYKSTWIQFTDKNGYRRFDYQFNADRFGEDAFHTKEEAEQALKE